MSRAAVAAFHSLYEQKRAEAGLDEEEQFVAYEGDTIGIDGYFTLQELQLILAAHNETRERIARGVIQPDPPPPKHEMWQCTCGNLNEIRRGEHFPPYCCTSCGAEKERENRS